MTDDAVTDFPGATDEDAAVRLARGRQWIAHQGVSYVPPWDDLTHAERDQATTEAGHWLTAAVNVGLLPPAREFECLACRGVVRARAVPAPAVDREGLAEQAFQIAYDAVDWNDTIRWVKPGPGEAAWTDVGTLRVQTDEIVKQAVDALISAGLVRVTGPAGQDGGD